MIQRASIEIDRPIERQAWTPPPIDVDEMEAWPKESEEGLRELNAGQPGSGNTGSHIGMVPSDSQMPSLLDQPIDPAMARERRKPFPLGFVAGMLLGILIGALTALISVRELF